MKRCSQPTSASHGGASLRSSAERQSAPTSSTYTASIRSVRVGIGTLYRHFPTRTDLIEAVYVEEVGALCRSADDLSDAPPWDALVGWLHRFIGDVATKHALAEELFAVADRDSEVFKTCRGAFYAAGEPLLLRAQAAGAVRPDVSIDDVVKMVGGIAKIQGTDPETVDRILSVALDGLRYSTS